MPAVYPRSTRVDVPDTGDRHAWLRAVSYEFGARERAREIDVVVAGLSGKPELWEPFSGARRSVESEPVEGGVRVRIPFDDGPCALLVWPGDDSGQAHAGEPPAEGERVISLDGEWDVQVESVLEDDWGDLAAPAPGVVEAWDLAHRTPDRAEWSPVHATFGPRALWAGPAREPELPAPGEPGGVEAR